MSSFSAIDMSKLPPPQVISTPDYEAILAQMKVEAIRVMPDLAAVLALESEPATKILQVCAYFRMLDRLAFNDGARANMLALATGSDLDQLAAFWGVGRLILQAEDTGQIPPTAAIYEDDSAFRARVQLSFEARSTAGPRGSYLFHALSADGAVKDAAVQSPQPGDVVVTVLAQSGDGTPGAALLDKVRAALNDEDIRPLCDHVIIQAASVVRYQITASLTLFDGPDMAVVQAAADTALRAYTTRQHRLGHDITRSGIFAALHQPGVQNVTLTAPAADLIIAPHEAAYCTTMDVQFGGRDV